VVARGGYLQLLTMFVVDGEQKIQAASGKMEEADAMVANANKVLDLANAHKSEALASQMETIAEEFKTAAAVCPSPHPACAVHLLRPAQDVHNICVTGQWQSRICLVRLSLCCI
jgi:hypothetical protein